VLGERGRIEEPISGEAAEASMAATFHGEGGRPAVGENSDEVLRLGEEDRKVRHQLNQSKNRGVTLTVKGRSRWCSGVVHAKTGELQRSKAANGVGVMRGRQRRNWTWSGGCDGNDKRGGVRSAASLPKWKGKRGRRCGPTRHTVKEKEEGGVHHGQA
jgi:hypothetical protein